MALKFYREVEVIGKKCLKRQKKKASGGDNKKKRVNKH